ncbi:efflux RND transporter periplasmic adaptor subunit [Rhodohalobacter halophilus]|uniref:efflux RND transporter periplasmic adaptor subunit n=1 Tax=Rhodohalobacter halophilus TaxID=1812810 RepID=UPI00083FB0EF|nr:efflux RND transporter periplasmic adaptor subunit [Rhodohalobacter halophilus]
MKLTIYLFALLLTLGFTFSSCSNDHANGNETKSNEISEAGGEDEHAEEESVHLTGLQIETAGIEFGTLESLPLSGTIKTNGFLELPPQNQAKISAVLGGIVKNIYVREGDSVNEGDVLADLVNPLFSEMQAEYRKTARQIGYLETDFRRKERLVNDEIGSQRELQLARSEYESALADMQSLQSKLRMLNLDPEKVLEAEIAESIQLKAPIGGFVRVIETSIGQYADPTIDLFEIVDNEHIHIDLLVYEKDIHRVRVDQEVLFKYTNQPNDQFYRARIFSVGKAFEDNPRAVRVHAEIEERQDGLLPGMFVEGRIVTGTTQSMVLPEDAVVRNGDEYLVFALHEADTPDQTEEDHGHAHEEEEMEFEVIMVRPGINDGGYTEVRFFEPLPEDIRFVTKGAYYLLAEMKKGEGGHEH